MSALAEALVAAYEQSGIRRGTSRMIAAIYARKSTEQAGVADDAKSVARQIENGRAFAAEKGWRRASTFSAMTPSREPTWGGFETVSGCYKPSRPGRRSRC